MWPRKALPSTIQEKEGSHRMSIGLGGIGAARRTNGPRRRLSTLAVAAALVGGTLGLTAPVATAQAMGLTVTAGFGDGTVAGQAYAPGDVTVAVGDSVTFAIGSDEPHTITMGEGPAEVPPPFWPVAGFAEPTPEQMELAGTPYDLGTVEYDGTGFINTGALFNKGSTATVTFTAAGTFPFFCVFHPGMAGIATVVEDGATTTQEDADAATAETRDLILGQVEPLREQRLAETSSVENDDGSTTWNVFTDAATETGAQPGGGSGYLELLEFTPAQMRIEPGDTISWTVAKIHTVTFVPEGMDPQSLFATEEALIPPQGGSTYDGTEVAHSGILGFPVDPAAGPVTEYSLTFPEPGVYPFFCALHVQLGQMGVVAVGVDLP